MMMMMMIDMARYDDDNDDDDRHGKVESNCCGRKSHDFLLYIDR